MNGQRHDLAAAFIRLARAMADAEAPVLAAHDVEMWDYAVLSTLADGPTSTQSELAASVRRDKTRLIPILDRLEARGLLRRTPDPADRRNRIVALTEAGHELVTACRRGIRQVESEMLTGMLDGRDARDLAVFIAVLDDLADAVGP